MARNDRKFDSEKRPEPSSRMPPEEIQRWYWTQAELRQIARQLGVPVGGTKAELTARVTASLAGEPLPGRKKPPRSRLREPLSRDTVIPEGVVLSRELRNWFVAELGPGFRADRHMRKFLKEGAGKTLGDAADLWTSTRGVPSGGIEPQFELNRFTRQWWRANPDGSREQLLDAWLAYRSTPVEGRIPPCSD